MLSKLRNYLSDKIPLMAGIGLFIAIHWTWNRIQHVPQFVDQSERKEIPIFTALRYLKRRTLQTLGATPAAENPSDTKAPQSK